MILHITEYRVLYVSQVKKYIDKYMRINEMDIMIN